MKEDEKMSEERVDKVERLLRQQRGMQLSPQFRQNVMAAIRRLPAPELIAPRRGWRDAVYAFRLLSSGEKVALGLILCGLIALLLPGAGELLLAAQWELGDLALSIEVGETVLSASLMSVIAVAAGLLAMTGVGAYAARNNLIGA